MDEFSTQPQHPETPQDSQETNATSRRNFLKVAVVSSAAAAAAVGGAGVAASALASRTPTGLSKLLVLNTSTAVSTTNACFTHTQEPFTDDTPGDPFNDNGSAFMWAWFTLPTHTDTDTFHLDFASDTPLPSWLGYQNTQSVDVYGNLSACPTTQPTGAIVTKATMGFDFSVPSGTSTILVQLHLNATKAPAGSTLTLDVELTGPGGFDSISEATAYFA